MNYNPMFNTQQRLAQMEQQYQQQNMFPAQISGNLMSVAGRVVDSFDSITANDVPMDNSGAIFVKRDNSEIQHRIWNADGTIKTTSYKPIVDVLDDKMVNLSSGETELKFALSDEVTEGIMNKFDEVMKKIDGLEKSIVPKPTTRTKKEVDSK
jgi:hypothetical protein